MEHKQIYDGCSGMQSVLWKLFLGKEPPWVECCWSHDIDYHRGGTKKERLESDRRLMACVKKRGYPKWAKIMYRAVRAGGHPLSPFQSRWGFGETWTPLYKKGK